jgi:hypothetical protein
VALALDQSKNIRTAGLLLLNRETASSPAMLFGTVSEYRL